jgi:hypothetical protein
LKPPSNFEEVDADEPDEDTIHEHPIEGLEVDDQGNPVAKGLRVVRIMPRGKVLRGNVRHVTITFSEPMVSIASVDDIDSGTVIIGLPSIWRGKLLNFFSV